MKINVYAVYDSKSTVFSTPSFISNDEVALRSFVDAANDPQSQFFKHPEDYILYRIGEYIDHTGELIALNPIKMIDTAIACKNRFKAGMESLKVIEEAIKKAETK